MSCGGLEGLFDVNIYTILGVGAAGCAGYELSANVEESLFKSVRKSREFSFCCQYAFDCNVVTFSKINASNVNIEILGFEAQK